MAGPPDSTPGWRPGCGIGNRSGGRRRAVDGAGGDARRRGAAAPLSRRRRLELAAPVDRIDVEAERVLAQRVGRSSAARCTTVRMAVQCDVPAWLPRS